MIIDYGEEESIGDTFQAVAGHAAGRTLRRSGQGRPDGPCRLRPAGPRRPPRKGQRAGAAGRFLERLGITARAQALARDLHGPALDRHIAAHRRLTHPDEMGHLFKVRALFPDAWPRRRDSTPDAEEARPTPMPA
jgi:NADH dehydrogenase [ubiquinone] 1 alpha subcomplex assembly factor 7